MSETIVARLTPAGSGAIAVLGLLGPRAWEALREQFRPTLSFEPTVGAVRFGRLGTERSADEVVLTVKRTSPQLWVEVHCHGGVEVVRWLTETFAARGLIPASGDEFLRRAAPALARLPQARTARTAAILLEIADGASVPADLDAHLTEPWLVVLAGPPNVGKSSLMNALAGFQRSIVAEVPGTTRDVVSVDLAIDGWPIRLIDTAGLRGAADLEARGIELARVAAATADLVLWLIDATTEPVGPPADLDPNKVLTVVAKTDLPSAWQAERFSEAVRVSAARGDGLADLGAAISRRLVPNPPSRSPPPV